MLLAGVVDLVQAAQNEAGPRVTPGQFVRAAIDELALLAPVGLFLGTTFVVAVYFYRRARAFAPLRRRLESRWFRRDPAGFSFAVGAMAGAGTLCLASVLLFAAFSTSFHRLDLAAVTFGPTMLGVGVASYVVLAFVATLVEPVAVRLGRVASIGTILVLTGLTALGVLAVIFGAYPEIVTTYGWARLSAPFVAIVSVVITRAALRVLERRVTLRIGLVIVPTLLTVALFVFSANTYHRSQAARSVVEQRTVAGRALVRTYSSLFDRDRDGVSSLFGGRDCDDSNARVYPGAIDTPGDGVDADCFAGDGSPDAAPLGSGRYGDPPASLTRPNMLLITVDALRPDSAMDAELAPHIRAFAEENVHFVDVTAQSSRSIRSIPALLTGLYPSQIAFGAEFQWPSLGLGNTTLAEVLRDHGYETSVILGTNYFSRSRDFLQGFTTHFEDPEHQPDVVLVTDRAIREMNRLREVGRPWFLWVHLFNVHAPHRFVDVETHGDEGDYRLLYDAEVRVADQQVDRLLTHLRTQMRGAWDNTVVALASDHGEAIGEHGVFGHSTTLYEPEVRAFLAARVPGVAARSVTGPVALFDLMPTFLNAGRIPMPVPTPARSLVPLMTGREAADPERAILSELLPDGHYPYDIKALRRGSKKLIWWVRDGSYLYFDVIADPAEQTDLTESESDEAERMLGLLRAWAGSATLPSQRRDAIVRDHVSRTRPSHITNPLDFRIPGVGQLLGFSLSSTVFHPGDTIDLTLYFHAEEDSDEDLYLEIPVFSDTPLPGGFHGSHFPVYAQYRMSDWRPGEYIRDPVQIIVPPETMRGTRARVLLWLTPDRGSDARIAFHLDGQERIEMQLFEFTVE